jgi:hypothetical protein
MWFQNELSSLAEVSLYFGEYEPNYSAQNGSTLLWNMSNCLLEYSDTLANEDNSFQNHIR